MSLVLDLLDLLVPTTDATPLLDAVQESRRDAKADAAWDERTAALAAQAHADLLVLAALHDGILSPTEREELAKSLPDLLSRAGVQTTADELIHRWDERLDGLEDEVLATVARSAAHWLSPPEKRQVYDAIVRLTREGPAASVTASTLALFAEALGIDEA